jgi:cytochrome c2
VKRAGLAVAAFALAAAAAARPAGDVRRGERAFQKCYSCHSVQPGEDGLSGPNLRGIVGRRIAAERRFDYSPALRSLARRRGRWTPALLDRFIADPEAVAPGTTMTFTGMPSAAERADLVAWLRTQR